MSFLRIEDMHIDLGDFSLRGVSLEFEQGEYLTVMGPTGAGKTILLECIIGFYRPAKGRVFLDGRDITDDPPEKRRIGIVYQDYALLPHKNVFKNIEYGLKKVDSDKDSRKAKILAMAESLNISHVLHRKPPTLSGGEQQRVALARALVVEPRLLLMDEPLSALDPQTRQTTRSLLRRIMRARDVTVLHITHDMDDVWALADKVAILRDGHMEQIASVRDVFNRPCNGFVADFVGASVYEGTVLPSSNGVSRGGRPRGGLHLGGQGAGRRQRARDPAPGARHGLQQAAQALLSPEHRAGQARGLLQGRHPVPPAFSLGRDVHPRSRDRQFLQRIESALRRHHVPGRQDGQCDAGLSRRSVGRRMLACPAASGCGRLPPSGGCRLSSLSRHCGQRRIESLGSDPGGSFLLLPLAGRGLCA